MWWAQLLNNIAALLGGGVAASTSSFESIATVTASGVVSAMSFGPNIPQTYSALQIRVMGRSNAAGTGNSAIYVNFGTGATAYAYHALNGDGATVTASGTASTSNAYVGLVPNNGNTSGIFGTAIIDLQDYASTSKYKTIRTFNGYDANGTGNSRLTSGLWQSTSAIGAGSTYIDIYCVGDFVAGSTIALYGIKGA